MIDYVDSAKECLDVCQPVFGFWISRTRGKAGLAPFWLHMKRLYMVEWYLNIGTRRSVAICNIAQMANQSA